MGKENFITPPSIENARQVVLEARKNVREEIKGRERFLDPEMLTIVVDPNFYKK